MDTWVQVDKFNDGDFVNADTLNTPIDQLASRTEYLKRRLGSIIDEGVQSALILNDVTLAADEADKMTIGSIVYMTEEDGFKLAQAKMHLYDSYVADATAFTVGVLIAKKNKTGDVLIYGKLDIGGNPLFEASNMLQSGEKLKSGRYYLSATEAGRITSKPTGPLIYVGSFHSATTEEGGFSSDAMACINPQFMDIGTSHVHRAYPLVARPAGHLSGTSVIGYLPDNHADTTKHYPSLIFGGTWTQKDGDKVNYKFVLSESSSWGNVTLSWYKDDSTSYQLVNIPATGVFVNLDNGLQVKVMFPGATSSNAFSDLTAEERIWNLTFPDAGKGWVNHEVTAIANVVGDDSISSSDDSNSSSGGLTTKMHVRITGSFGTDKQDIYCSVPTQYSSKTFGVSDTIGKFIINGVKYQFVSEGETADSGHTPIIRAGTNLASLHKLADIVNDGQEEAILIVQDRKSEGIRIYALNVPAMKVGDTYQDLEDKYDGFDIVGGTITKMFVYNSNYEMLGDIIENENTYTDIPLSSTNLSIMVYADNATSGTNYTCEKGTLLQAEAYDYTPDAIYDYVMGLHQSVDYYYPPVPAQAAGLFVNGVEVESSALFPDNPTYVIGHKTLHWMEEDAEHLPWPAGITGHDDPVEPSDDKTMAFYFIVGFQCASGPVTSIVPAPNAPIKIYTYGTKEPAYTGDVMIDADFDFHVNDAGVPGYKVAKEGKGGALLAGPVVEKIKAGNGIIVKSDPGCPKGQGTVTIALDNGTIRDHFNEIALENAKQEKLGLFPYISLLGWRSGYSNIPSAFTMMMRVPTSLDQNKNFRLQLRMTMFGAGGYSSQLRRVAGIQLEYNILPDYTGDTHNSLKTGLIAPTSPRQINVPFGHSDGGSMQVYEAFDPFVATTEDNEQAPKSDDVCVAFSDLPIPSNEELEGVVLKPGYLVAVRISRVSPTNVGGNTGNSEYTDPIGFLSMEWSLEEV